MRRAMRLLLWRATGFDISMSAPGHGPLDRRQKILRHHGIEVILDVGANTGQFAREMRQDLRFPGKVISFEPLAAQFQVLAANAAGDASWDAVNYGLGDSDQEMTINVSGSSASSSLLPMLPGHTASAPGSEYVGTERVLIRRLDSVLGSLGTSSTKIFLKVDVQGFERQVIEGARQSLARIPLVQLELSLIPLYSGQLLLPEMVLLMREAGYDLIGMDPVFTDAATGHLLQVDGTFARHG